MFRFEANDNNVIVQASKMLEAALSTNPKTQKALQKVIRQELFRARAQVVSGIHFKNGDPRGAARAVRTTVYRRVLGGDLNIKDSKRAHGSTNYQPPRKGSTGRGGNRRPRNANTVRYMSYDGLDRGFILRWINSGTQNRAINFTKNERRKTDQWNKHPNTGNRGSISARHFFMGLGERSLNQAVDNLSRLIEEELKKIMTE